MPCHEERGVIGSTRCPECDLPCDVMMCPKCDDGRLVGHCARHGDFGCKFELV